MNSGLSILYKFYFYIGLAGFSGCYLSFFLSLNNEIKKRLHIEAVSTFLLGTAFTGVLLTRPLPDFMYLNIFISVTSGIISSFLAVRFLQVSLKKTFESEIEV